MAYIFIKFFGMVKCNFTLVFLFFLYGGSLKFRLPFIGDSAPSIKIRQGGCVNFGKIKTRTSLHIFADGGKIAIKDGCFFNNSCSISSMKSVEIAEGTLFGENVKIYDHDHEFHIDTGVSIDSFLSAPIKIGKHCWIGSNVIILKGVVISDNVLVGAGCIVKNSILEAGVYVNSGLSKVSKIR